jgi:hypothetical protein
LIPVRHQRWQRGVVPQGFHGFGQFADMDISSVNGGRPMVMENFHALRLALVSFMDFWRASKSRPSRIPKLTLTVDLLCQRVLCKATKPLH